MASPNTTATMSRKAKKAFKDMRNTLEQENGDLTMIGLYDRIAEHKDAIIRLIKSSRK